MNTNTLELTLEVARNIAADHAMASNTTLNMALSVLQAHNEQNDEKFIKMIVSEIEFRKAAWQNVDNDDGFRY